MNFMFICVNINSSPTTVHVIKSRKMRWAGNVARIGEGRGVYRVLVGGPDGKRPLGCGGPGVGGRIILGWIFRKWDEGVRTGLSWLGIETIGAHL
jgi:hypothetical protein